MLEIGLRKAKVRGNKGVMVKTKLKGFKIIQCLINVP